MIQWSKHSVQAGKKKKTTLGTCTGILHENLPKECFWKRKSPPDNNSFWWHSWLDNSNGCSRPGLVETSTYERIRSGCWRKVSVGSVSWTSVFWQTFLNKPQNFNIQKYIWGLFIELVSSKDIGLWLHKQYKQLMPSITPNELVQLGSQIVKR